MSDRFGNGAAVARFALSTPRLYSHAFTPARPAHMTSRTVEIARREGESFRSVRLTIGDDGALTMGAQDIGPHGTGILGPDEDNEYEFWVRIAPAAVPQLAFELLHEKFAGQLGAVDALRDWCKARGIEHKFGSWF
jgi:hypothetical protein